ncbi:diguanylate cyclase [uncultured Campylobacter sp.]|uniref:diguanylate cyclase n=1 Tax=uncultured Campylobacter sp. TaxID=218934 RepID=UPI0032119E61
MATSVNQVIKETIQTIKERGLMITPDNYAEVFCEIAKKNGVIVPDCQKLEKYSARLNDELKAQLKQKNVRNLDELFAFMAARLNSPGLAEYPKLINALIAMNKKVFQAVASLHNKNAKNLAEASSEALNRRLDAQAIDRIKDKWFDFLTDYDDSFLKRLGVYGVKNFSDLKDIVAELEDVLTKEQTCEKLVPLVSDMLRPSITDKIDGEIEKVNKILKSDPKLLEDLSVRKNIENLTKKRIELDRAEVSTKVGSLDKVLDGINDQIASLISSSSKSSSQMQFIKNDLNSINLNEDSFEGIRDKLKNIADTLDVEVRQLGEQMLSDQQTIKELQAKVSKLEVELESAKAESKEDFLTKTATKKALMEELGRLELDFLQQNADYAVCFFDIDHFKNINDIYGHDAGDVIIASVGRVLRGNSREVDFVARYGGEEFVVLLPGFDMAQSIGFADKVRDVLKNSKFLYKDERISVTVSCGVAIRSQNQSQAAVLEASDKMLYQAKQNGRDQVMPKI